MTAPSTSRWFTRNVTPGANDDELIVCKRFPNGNRLVTTMIWWRGRAKSAEWQEVTHWMPMPQPPSEEG